MKPIKASTLVIAAKGKTPKPTTATNAHSCNACGTALNGQGVAVKLPDTFFDQDILISPDVTSVYCGECASLFGSDCEDLQNVSGTGVASLNCFQRFLTNMERLRLFIEPPEPPFAVAVVNAKRQHVWTSAKTTYDPRRIHIQFGRRAMLIDVSKAIEIAEAIRAYATKHDRPVLIPISRDLRAVTDGQFAPRFARDQGEDAIRLKALFEQASFDDVWAAYTITSGLRELKVTTVREAREALPTL